MTRQLRRKPSQPNELQLTLDDTLWDCGTKMVTEQEFKQIDLDDEVWIFGVLNGTSYVFPSGQTPLIAFSSQFLIAVKTKVTSVTRNGFDTLSFAYECDGVEWCMDNLYGHEFVHQILRHQGGAAIKPKPVQPKLNVGPLSCVSCNTVNEYAEPNLPDGKLACYGCRIWSDKLQKLHLQFLGKPDVDIT